MINELVKSLKDLNAKLETKEKIKMQQYIDTRLEVFIKRAVALTYETYNKNQKRDGTWNNLVERKDKLGNIELVTCGEIAIDIAYNSVSAQMTKNDIKYAKKIYQNYEETIKQKIQSFYFIFKKRIEMDYELVKQNLLDLKADEILQKGK